MISSCERCSSAFLNNCRHSWISQGISILLCPESRSYSNPHSPGLEPQIFSLPFLNIRNELSGKHCVHRTFPSKTNKQTKYFVISTSHVSFPSHASSYESSALWINSCTLLINMLHWKVWCVLLTVSSIKTIISSWLLLLNLGSVCLIGESLSRFTWFELTTFTDRMNGDCKFKHSVESSTYFFAFSYESFTISYAVVW